MNLLTFVRLSLLLGPLYLWFTFSIKLRKSGEFTESHNYEKTTDNNAYFFHSFIAISCICLLITSYVDNKINVSYKHYINISLIIIPYIIYTCKSINFKGLPIILSLLIISPFIMGHILLYCIIFTIMKEKYERYNSGLPLFTTEEKQSYIEMFIKHYCKKDEKCCCCECKCK